MQQFTIQSEKIRDKLTTLLHSQNVGGIGVELTGSTQIIPIVDLTEIAEGSDLRQDLQSALSLSSCTAFNVVNAATTIVNTTGTFRVFGVAFVGASSSAAQCTISVTDGTTTKVLYTAQGVSSSQVQARDQQFDFLVKVGAGESIIATTNSTIFRLDGVTRQIADLSGNLVNP